VIRHVMRVSIEYWPCGNRCAPNLASSVPHPHCQVLFPRESKLSALFSTRLNDLNVKADLNPHAREIAIQNLCSVTAVRYSSHSFRFLRVITTCTLNFPSHSVQSTFTSHSLRHLRFPSRSGPRAYRREETRRANSSGTRWTLRYALNGLNLTLTIRIRQIGFQVHVHFVDVMFHLLEASNVPSIASYGVEAEDKSDGNVDLVSRDPPTRPTPSFSQSEQAAQNCFLLLL
jgi:hypothetical protein